jgi:hypothetical protein
MCFASTIFYLLTFEFGLLNAEILIRANGA